MKYCRRTEWPKFVYQFLQGTETVVGWLLFDLYSITFSVVNKLVYFAFYEDFKVTVYFNFEFEFLVIRVSDCKTSSFLNQFEIFKS